ncbi:MAG: bifunctional folylpolyglutamate synthase/dihydrofolate synthase, partial [Methanomassiliicoccaceae archaeon]|nr:bifunctional folylpolyglutamate synthase/dihydrofolate synthase [Methanomassiliicoccaceae archaeon]
SDGKGSTCAMLYSILMNANISVGMYTSPHLIRFNERTSVNGKEIDDNELENLMQIVKPIVDKMLSEGMDPTFFEVSTAIAFLHLSKKNVEYAVLETGMGGRLDATNAVTPEITAITNISNEHSDILGDTIEKIAFEKAGIIKNDVPIITANKGSALNVIKDVADKKGSLMIAIDPDDIMITSFDDGYVTMNYCNNEYQIGIPGRCQSENAAIAIECAKQIKKVNIGNITEGLRNVRWRGRMEYFPDENIIVDVTHTSAGAKQLASDISEAYGKVTLIIGTFRDKSAEDICKTLSRISSKVIVTEPNSERALPSEELTEIMKRYSDKVFTEKNLEKAIDSAKGKRISDETILITGSLHMAGEAISYLERKR